jgi:pimeloyl-ACP methyl ester carboxylesterase
VHEPAVTRSTGDRLDQTDGFQRLQAIEASRRIAVGGGRQQTDVDVAAHEGRHRHHERHDRQPQRQGTRVRVRVRPRWGDTLIGLQTRYPGSKLNEAALDFRPYGDGHVDSYIKKDVFRDVFAGDLPRSTTDLMWASQRPSDVVALQEPSGAPAWKTIPSWYLVARNDNVIPAEAQRFMAQRANAHVTEVRSSHVAMIAQPGATADLIKRAAR